MPWATCPLRASASSARRVFAVSLSCEASSFSDDAVLEPPVVAVVPALLEYVFELSVFIGCLLQAINGELRREFPTVRPCSETAGAADPCLACAAR